jgi:rhombotail lipoprotein
MALVSTSTLARASGEILDARRNSYALAIDDMSTNLLTELDRFRVCMEEVPSVAQGVRTNGDGGSAMLPLMLLVLLMAALGPAVSTEAKKAIVLRKFLLPLHESLANGL